ncbi:MAG: ribose 5-phosphate isomerase B [Ignavibacteria bacterium]
MLKIAIGSDHRGFILKNYLVDYLKTQGYEVIDFGTYSSESVDYPDYATLVAKAVANQQADYGIAICGSGIGVSIAANRVKGVRAVNATNEKVSEMSRRHNNANVICFGGDYIEPDTAVKYLEIFFNTPFDGGERHQRRIQKIDII